MMNRNFYLVIKFLFVQTLFHVFHHSSTLKMHVYNNYISGNKRVTRMLEYITHIYNNTKYNSY